MTPSAQHLEPVRKLFVQKDEHKFSCAHMTIFPDGTKERLHGHNYRLAVAVTLEAGDHPMLDFARVKAVLAERCAGLREHLLMPSLHPSVQVVRHDHEELELRICGRRYVLPADEVLLLPMANVVVEELAAHLWDVIERDLRADLVKSGGRWLEVTVTEAPGQGASFAAPVRVGAP